MDKKLDISHCVMAPWGHYKCNHCGATKKATTPAKIRDFVAEGRAFTDEHANCKKPDIPEFKRGDRISVSMARGPKLGVFLKHTNHRNPTRVKVKLDGNAYPKLVDIAHVAVSTEPFLYKNNAS